MPGLPERTPQEQETLIFSQPETGREFREQVSERLRQEAQQPVRRNREVVAAALADQFVQAGESVESLREPWLHTEAEHAEVQQLADVAFAEDLPAALRRARQSAHYPRNLDLLHDVLTGELYELLRTHEVNRQPLLGVGLLIGGIGLVVVIVALLLVFLT